MSDLRKSKLVLKTSDLFSNTLNTPDAVVKGFILSSNSIAAISSLCFLVLLFSFFLPFPQVHWHE